VAAAAFSLQGSPSFFLYRAADKNFKIGLA